MPDPPFPEVPMLIAIPPPPPPVPALPSPVGDLADPGPEPGFKRPSPPPAHGPLSVSYTHLTLPTKQAV